MTSLSSSDHSSEGEANDTTSKSSVDVQLTVIRSSDGKRKDVGPKNYIIVCTMAGGAQRGRKRKREKKRSSIDFPGALRGHIVCLSLSLTLDFAAIMYIHLTL